MLTPKQMKKHLLLSCVCIIFAANAQSNKTKMTETISPPLAASKPKQLEKHGDVRTDNYYWLNERENPEVIDYLTKEGALVQISDINEARMQEVSAKYGAAIFAGDDVYSADVDIYAPCALGATINDTTIDKIKAKVIAGAANNQLANEVVHGKILQDRGILYAPDFLINAGGIINVYSEIVGYDSAEAMRRTENIYNTTLEIFSLAETQGITTQQAAMAMAQKRIDDRKKETAK